MLHSTLSVYMTLITLLPYSYTSIYYTSKHTYKYNHPQSGCVWGGGALNLYSCGRGEGEGRVWMWREEWEGGREWEGEWGGRLDTTILRYSEGNMYNIEMVLSN